MKKIYIVRHGESHSNAGGHAMLNADIPLTELGHSQAKEVADWLMQKTNGDINSINVSKYLRTHLTAEPLVQLTRFQPKVIDGLEEFNYLAFETIEHMKTAQIIELATCYWEDKSPDYVDGEGSDEKGVTGEGVNGLECVQGHDDGKANNPESFRNFEQRTGRVLEELHTLEDGTHVVYGHGLWISMLVWKILAQPVDDTQAMQNFRQFEMSIRAKNCEVFLLTLEEDRTPAITKVRIRDDDSYNAV